MKGIIKLYLSKYKKILWIACAIMFLVLLFILKTGFIFKNTATYKSANQENGLTYNNLTIEDSVNTDTDGDGILDWQEGLYGLDPTKKETTPGTLDSVAIEKLRAARVNTTAATKTIVPTTENLTATDKFSRELFATVAAASQNGTMDQATIETLGASLADKIQNSPQRKVFSVFDIKIINDNSAQAFTNYNTVFNGIFEKNRVNYRVVDVLQKFIIDENNVDASALAKLDPIIEQMNKIITALLKMSVPQSISTLHLNFINATERLLENLTDIRLYDTDPILSMGAIIQYQNNSILLTSSIKDLTNAIQQKLPQ